MRAGAHTKARWRPVLEHKVGHSGKGRQQTTNKQPINNRFASAQGRAQAQKQAQKHDWEHANEPLMIYMIYRDSTYSTYPDHF